MVKMKIKYLAPWPLSRYRTEDHPEVLVQLSSGSVSQSEKSSTQRSVSEITIPAEKSRQSESSIEAVTSSATSKSIIRDGQARTIENLRARIDTIVGQDSSPQKRRAALFNEAIDDIGHGYYQRLLFFLSGLGWFCDNIWLTIIPLLLPQIDLEFSLRKGHDAYTLFSLMLGLAIGATGWGTISDILGRRIPFNSTLLITSAFGIGLSFATDWTTFNALISGIGLGVGGNLPVDGTLYLEFLPGKNHCRMVLMTVFWGIGAVVTSAVGYRLIPSKSCTTAKLPACGLVDVGIHCCTSAENTGWRSLVFYMGWVTLVCWLIRVVSLHILESPKILLSKRKPGEAVKVIHALAWFNGRTTWMTEEILNDIGGNDDQSPAGGTVTRVGIIRIAFAKFLEKQLRPLFVTARVGLNTTLVILGWLLLGLAYPLFISFLPKFSMKVNHGKQDVNTSIVYRNLLICHSIGCLGAPLGWFLLVKVKLGRKWSMGACMILGGIFIVVFVDLKTSEQQLAVSTCTALCLYAGYAILFMYTPECFSAESRGTGVGLANGFNRLGGIVAPLIAVHAGKGNAEVLLRISAGLVIAAGVLMCFLRETRQSL